MTTSYKIIMQSKRIKLLSLIVLSITFIILVIYFLPRMIIILPLKMKERNKIHEFSLNGDYNGDSIMMENNEIEFLFPVNSMDKEITYTVNDDQTTGVEGRGFDITIYDKNYELFVQNTIEKDYYGYFLGASTLNEYFFMTLDIALEDLYVFQPISILEENARIYKDKIVFIRMEGNVYAIYEDQNYFYKIVMDVDVVKDKQYDIINISLFKKDSYEQITKIFIWSKMSIDEIKYIVESIKIKN